MGGAVVFLTLYDSHYSLIDVRGITIVCTKIATINTLPSTVSLDFGLQGKEKFVYVQLTASLPSKSSKRLLDITSLG